MYGDYLCSMTSAKAHDVTGAIRSTGDRNTWSRFLRPRPAQPHMFGDRIRLSFLALVVTLFVPVAGILPFRTLYNTALDQQRERLADIAHSQRAMIRAAIRRHAYASETADGIVDAVLKDLRKGKRVFGGFEKTSELALATRRDDTIVFLLNQRRSGPVAATDVPLASDSAEPMRRALLGQSGTMIGRDYRGHRVLAAYEPIHELGLGLVVKIDLAEVHALYAGSALITAACIIVFTVVAVVLFWHIGGTLLRHLEDNENKYRTLFTSSTHAVFLLISNVIQDCNNLGCRFLGCPREEIVGRSFLGFFFPLQPGEDGPAQVIQELLENGESESAPRMLQCRYASGHGSTRIAELWLRVVALNGQNQLLLTMTDITARIEAEQALRQSELRFRSVAEAASDAIILADSAGNIVSWNSGAQEIFGYREEEIVGRPLTLLMPERLRDSHQHGWSHFLPTADANIVGKTIELTAARKTGEEFPCDACLSTWTADDQRFFSIILRDISERVEAEANKQELQKQLWQAQKLEALGVLAGGIAHDFNNLLLSIIGGAELAKDKIAGDASIQENLDCVLDAGLRAKELVSQILTFGRQETLQREPTEIRDVLEEAMALVEATLPPTINIRTDLSPAVAEISPVQITQVIVNLCTNSYHAMEKTGGTLTVRARPVRIDAGFAAEHAQAREGAYIRISISDTGCGIDEDIQGRIFEPFFTTKPQGKGTGLGLSVV